MDPSATQRHWDLQLSFAPGPGFLVMMYIHKLNWMHWARDLFFVLLPVVCLDWGEPTGQEYQNSSSSLANHGRDDGRRDGTFVTSL